MIARLFLIICAACVPAILHAQQAASVDSLVVINVASLNSSAADGYPNIPDANTIYFTRLKHISDTSPNHSSHLKYEEWVAVRSANSIWSHAQHVLSMDKLGAVGALTTDSAGEVFFASDHGNTLNKDDWDIFTLVNKKIVNLGYPVNTSGWECQPSITQDGKDLYFVSRRGPNKKTEKIYVSHRLHDWIWSEPEMLRLKMDSGKSIGWPFITNDRKTLLFASGFVKNGKLKLYMSTKTGPSTTDWSDPIELPFPINTSDDSMSPCLSPDNHELYFSSNRPGGKGGFDIYLVRLPHGIEDLLPKTKQ
jgi:hypothetical protein